LKLISPPGREAVCPGRFLLSRLKGYIDKLAAFRGASEGRPLSPEEILGLGGYRVRSPETRWGLPDELRLGTLPGDFRAAGGRRHGLLV
jgi:hypothetical protein